MHEALSTLGSYTLEALAPILAALLSLLAIKALRWAGLKVDAAQEAKLDEVARAAVAYAEEQARKALKMNEPAKDGKDKMALALGYANTALKGNLPAGFEARIEAQLSMCPPYNR